MSLCYQRPNTRKTDIYLCFNDVFFQFLPTNSKKGIISEQKTKTLTYRKKKIGHHLIYQHFGDARNTKTKIQRQRN